jgi:hypothetical protein
VKFKTMPATVAPQDTDDGVFEAVVSVFNNKDYGGDIVRPGAFKNSLDFWGSSDSPIPVYWSHRMDDPMMNIGEVIDAEELAGGAKAIPDWANSWVKEHGGLYVKAKLDDYGMAAQVRHLMKQRRVKQFSFSYDVINESRSKSGDYTELLDLFLHEVGPTPLGMNPLTELISAKAKPPDPPEPDTKTTAAKRRFFYAFNAEYAALNAELAD